MKRDLIQGFIDGYLSLGGDVTKLRDAVDAWMKSHPVYPMNDLDRTIILDDLPSYRGVTA